MNNIIHNLRYSLIYIEIYRGSWKIIIEQDKCCIFKI